MANPFSPQPSPGERQPNVRVDHIPEPPLQYPWYNDCTVVGPVVHRNRTSGIRRSRGAIIGTPAMRTVLSGVEHKRAVESAMDSIDFPAHWPNQNVLDQIEGASLPGEDPETTAPTDILDFPAPADFVDSLEQPGHLCD